MIPGLGRFPGGEHSNPLQYSCLENPHGQRSLVGYIPWGHKELDVTEQLSTAHMYLRWLNRVLQNSYVEALIPTGHYLATYALSHSLDLIYSCSPHSASATLAFLWLQVKYTHISLSLSTYTHTHQEKTT